MENCEGGELVFRVQAVTNESCARHRHDTDKVVPYSLARMSPM